MRCPFSYQADESALARADRPSQKMFELTHQRFVERQYECVK